MRTRVSEVYELNPTVDDPRFEGFAMDRAPSVLGRETLDDDLSPGFADAENNPNWKQPSLRAKWKAPMVQGRVAEFNDYPCVDMVLPAFSERAVVALHDILEPNGELLPLKSKTKTKYFLYNLLTISDALDQTQSDIEFWCDPPTTAVSVDHFAFNETKLRGLSIFHIREEPVLVLVTNEFVDRVRDSGLQGFSFKKVWPLPRSANWRMQPDLDAENRKELKRETLVLMLPWKGTAAQRRRIAQFETAIDAKLRPQRLSSKYYGAYEGHDELKEEYRMFFSCPGATQLFKFLREEIETLKWPSPIHACLRHGEMYDQDAPETMKTIDLG